MNHRETTVLYVDDNAMAIRLLGTLLRDSGFEVITANDPIEALSICKQVSFDLALLDFEMRNLADSHLTEEIRSLTPHVPVVLISGRTTLPVGQTFLADAHFGSHTSLDDLLETMWTLTRLSPEKCHSPRPAVDWSNST